MDKFNDYFDPHLYGMKHQRQRWYEEIGKSNNKKARTFTGNSQVVDKQGLTKCGCDSDVV